MIKKIFLDFYNNNLICFNAKQNDSGRKVEITCTDHGKKYTLDKSRMSVLVAYKNANGDEDLINGTIQDDGTILVELDSGILRHEGKSELDVIVIAQYAITTDNFETVQAARENTSSLISTMKFYINVISSSVSYEEIEKSDDYKYLVRALTRLNELQTELSGLRNQIYEMVGDSSVESILDDANAAADRADAAAQRLENAMNGTEEVFIPFTQKGANNGVATLNESGKIPSSQLQLPIANNLTTQTAGYVLDASQGYALNESKQDKITGAAKTALSGTFTKNNIVVTNDDGYIVPSGQHSAQLNYLKYLADFSEDTTVKKELTSLSEQDTQIISAIGELMTDLAKLSSDTTSALTKKEDAFDVLPVEKGGTGATSIDEAKNNILGYKPVWVKMVLTADRDNYAADSVTFTPFYSSVNGGEVDFTSNTQLEEVIPEGEETSYFNADGALFIKDMEVNLSLDGTHYKNTHVIEIGDNVNYVRISADVRYKSEESTNGTHVHTYVKYEDDEIGGSFGSSSDWVAAGKYASQHINTIIPVKKGGYLFISSYKGEADKNIDVKCVHDSTQFIVEVVG